MDARGTSRTHAAEFMRWGGWPSHEKTGERTPEAAARLEIAWHEPGTSPGSYRRTLGDAQQREREPGARAESPPPVFDTRDSQDGAHSPWTSAWPGADQMPRSRHPAGDQPERAELPNQRQDRRGHPRSGRTHAPESHAVTVSSDTAKTGERTPEAPLARRSHHEPPSTWLLPQNRSGTPTTRSGIDRRHSCRIPPLPCYPPRALRSMGAVSSRDAADTGGRRGDHPVPPSPSSMGNRRQRDHQRRRPSTITGNVMEATFETVCVGMSEDDAISPSP